MNAHTLEFNSHEEYAAWYAIEYYEFDVSAWAETKGDHDNSRIVFVHDDLANIVELFVWFDENGNEEIYDAIEK